MCKESMALLFVLLPFFSLEPTPIMLLTPYSSERALVTVTNKLHVAKTMITFHLDIIVFFDSPLSDARIKWLAEPDVFLKVFALELLWSLKKVTVGRS